MLFLKWISSCDSTVWCCSFCFYLTYTVCEIISWVMGRSFNTVMQTNVLTDCNLIPSSCIEWRCVNMLCEWKVLLNVYSVSCFWYNIVLPNLYLCILKCTALHSPTQCSIVLTSITKYNISPNSCTNSCVTYMWESASQCLVWVLGWVPWPLTLTGIKILL